MKFKKVLRKVILKAVSLGLTVKYSDSLDPYFKGDMDGETILLSFALEPAEQLFSVLHLIGHSIQWNVDPELRILGDRLYHSPDDDKLRSLQEYEWEANCYALQILHECKVYDMDDWLDRMYTTDMMYLTNFYKTGKKSYEITDIARKYTFTRTLLPIEIPKFTPIASVNTRNGIVI